MRIGVVFDGDYPWDIRVWKVATCLVDHGHEVHLVCRNIARRPEEEAVEGLRIHRLRPVFVERSACGLVDPVVVVIEEARDRLLKAGFRADRISIVRNTPKIELTRFPTAWGTPACDATKLTVVFVGGLDLAMRGLE